MISNLWISTKKVASAWSEDKVASMSAALAYYTIFSITPLLIISIALAGFFLGPEAARGQVLEQISGLIGHDTGVQIQTMIEGANKPKTAIFAQIGGILMLIIGAGGVFGELQSSLNSIFGVPFSRNQSWWDIIKERFWSFSMILGVAFLLLVSLVLTAIVTAISHSIVGYMGIDIITTAATYMFAFLIVTLLFAMIYKILPNKDIAWSEVWPGALTAALLFALGKFLLGLYLAQVHVTSTFGAAGAIVVILIWSYYTAQILFIGAEITKIISLDKEGSRK